MFCENITITGTMELANARIGGSVSLERARLANPDDVALDARYLQAGQVRLIPAAPVQSTVDLSHAHIGLLVDDPACWPAALNLSGLTYQALEPQLPAMSGSAGSPSTRTATGPSHMSNWPRTTTR